MWSVSEPGGWQYIGGRRRPPSSDALQKWQTIYQLNYFEHKQVGDLHKAYLISFISNVTYLEILKLSWPLYKNMTSIFAETPQQHTESAAKY